MPLKGLVFFCFITMYSIYPLSAQQVRWKADHGKAEIESDASLELIKAESNALKGVIIQDTKSFAFSLPVNSFEGFNSDLQRTHFLENYMEQKKYPQAIFTGKLIEDIPFNTPGTYDVRAKGNLEIHGVTKERIIRGTLTISDGSIYLATAFSVPVSDHGITIPKIVNQKIAEQILVNIHIKFSEDNKL